MLWKNGSSFGNLTVLPTGTTSTFGTNALPALRISAKAGARTLPSSTHTTLGVASSPATVAALAAPGATAQHATAAVPNSARTS